MTAAPDATVAASGMSIGAVLAQPVLSGPLGELLPAGEERPAGDKLPDSALPSLPDLSTETPPRDTLPGATGIDSGGRVPQEAWRGGIA